MPATRCAVSTPPSSAGAERITLCDTNGGTLPDRVESLVREITARFGSIAGIHCHDNSGCAVAATLAAVRAGAVQVQGCINGYGERTGNANLCTLIPNLQLKMGLQVIDDEQLARLTEVARDVAEIANIAPPLSAPYIGQAAFTHKGGQHIDAMSKASYAYQHIDPARVGNERHSVITQQSGRGTVLEKAAAFGVDLTEDRALARRVADEVKQLEFSGHSFEGAEASFELLVHRARGNPAPFTLIDYIALVEQREGRSLVCEATIKVQVGDAVVHTAAEGNGPVNALDAALRKALDPELSRDRRHPAVRLQGARPRRARRHRGRRPGARRKRRPPPTLEHGGLQHQHHRGVVERARRRLRVRDHRDPRRVRPCGRAPGGSLIRA